MSTSRTQWQMIRRHKWIFGATVALAVLLAIVYSAQKTPVYQATAKLQLTPVLAPAALAAINSSSTSLAATVDVPTSIQVLQSTVLQSKVESTVPAAPPVAASQIGTTDVVALSVRSTSSTLAASAANAYAAQYIKLQRTNSTRQLSAAANTLQTQSARLTQYVLKLQNELAHTPSGAQADSLNAELSASEETALSIRQQLVEYQTALTLTTGGGEIIGLATAPQSPIVPKPAAYVAAALVVGLLLAVGLVRLIERIDDRIDTEDQLAQIFKEVPVVARIPRIAGPMGGSRDSLVTMTDQLSPGSEGFRVLRTTLRFFAARSGSKTVQVTSPFEGDGKSLIAANLALSCAQSGLNVALVDCDVRRPTVHRMFGFTNKVGLADVVLGEIQWADALNDVAEAPGLKVLTAGQDVALPAELLDAGVTRKVIATLESEFDVVVIDSAPILPVADATIVAQYSGATLLVIAANRTAIHDVSRSLTALAQVGVTPLGFVMNMVSSNDRDYRYGYPRQRSAADDGQEAAITTALTHDTTASERPWEQSTVRDDGAASHFDVDDGTDAQEPSPTQKAHGHSSRQPEASTDQMGE